MLTTDTAIEAIISDEPFAQTDPRAAVGAVHAAVTGFGLEHRVALLALIEPLAGVCGHRLGLGVATLGTGQRRLQDHRCHLALPTTVEG